MTKKKDDEDKNKSGHPFTHTEIKAPHGGKEAVYEMFQHLDEAHKAKLISEIKLKDPKFAQEIIDHLFVFEDLKFLDSKALLLICRSAQESTLALALRGGSEELRDVFYKSLPSRSSESLRDLIHTLGPQVKKAILDAQAEVLKTARDLETQGKLLLKKI